MSNGMDEEEKKSKIGSMFRGQRWAELYGTFSPEELRSLADQIEENCKGLEKLNVSSK